MPDLQNEAKWLHLFTNPRRFFRHLEKFRKQSAMILLAILLVGMGESLDRMSDAKADDFPFPEMIDNWAYFWLGIGGMGLLNGAVDWLIGGWFFHMRVRWSGDLHRDKTEARLIYIFTSMIIALPTLAIGLVETLVFESHRETRTMDKLVWWMPMWGLVLVSMFYSIYASYQGVLVRFQVDPEQARRWFLILPGMLYGLSLLLILSVIF